MQYPPAGTPGLMFYCQPCLSSSSQLCLNHSNFLNLFCPLGFNLLVRVTLWRFPAFSPSVNFYDTSSNSLLHEFQSDAVWILTCWILPLHFLASAANNINVAFAPWAMPFTAVSPLAIPKPISEPGLGAQQRN